MPSSLASFATTLGLDREQAQVLQRLSRTTYSGRAREVLVGPREPLTSTILMLHGWAVRYKTLSNGKRQIVGFLISGDIGDPDVLTRDAGGCSVALLTDSLYALIDKREVAASVVDDPWILDILFDAAACERAILREWLVNIGSRTAVARLAHLLLELHFRQEAAGLTAGACFNLPFSQEVLGEALGLTSVSVCRSFKNLKASGLIDMTGRTLRFKDLPGMIRIGEFDFSYLARGTVRNCDADRPSYFSAIAKRSQFHDPPLIEQAS